MSPTIAELWRYSDPPPAPAPEVDPLTRTDALDEAQVLDVRLDGVHGLLGVLLELRVAMHQPEGHAGLLVLREVQHVSWNAEPFGRRHVREVVDVVVDTGGGATTVRLGFGLDEWLLARGGEPGFHVLEVPSLPDAPPDYVSLDEESVQRGLPQWHSPCRVLRTSRTPTPSAPVMSSPERA